MIRLRARALLTVLAVVAFPSAAADIVLTPPTGGGVSVTNAAGDATRFRVADDGSITLPALSAVPVPSTSLCVEIATGKVGTCGPGTGGTVTSIATGLGLAGGPITSSGTISADTNVLQARVSGSCAAGSSIRAIAAAGTVTCQTDANSGGTVTAVTASAPLASSGGATPNITLASPVPVNRGGTGASSLAINGVLVGLGTSAITGTVAGTTGQVLIGNTGFPPSWSGSLALAGNLDLPNSASPSVGNITKSGTPFIHNYGPENTFIGFGAGNFTMTGTGRNFGGGYAALAANTSGFNNTASGHAALTSNTSGAGNTASGQDALTANTTGSTNTASGSQALKSNTTGSSNTASGYTALHSNTSGGGNVASGYQALYSNTTGADNTATGYRALFPNTTGFHNTASGAFALNLNTTGGANTASGYAALSQNTTGNSNIAVGAWAGSDLTTGSSNIVIGNYGVAGEGNTIRIGTSQSRAFVAGIRGRTTGNADAIPVLIDGNGQLGTVSSSRRFKDAIADMSDASAALMKLRPVTFQYRQQPAILQYGLIAEEVAEVYPGLIARSADGEVETVMYQFLPAMLLNEYQKQQRTIEEQVKRIAELEEKMERLVKAFAGDRH